MTDANMAGNLDALFNALSQSMKGVPGFEGDPLKDPQGAMKAQMAYAQREIEQGEAIYGRALTTPEGMAMLQHLAEATFLRSPVPDISTLASFDQLAPLMLWNAAQAELVRSMAAMARKYFNNPDDEEGADDDE